MRGSHPNYRPPASLPAALRRTGVPEAAREWVRRRMKSEVVHARRLPGASSTAVHLLVLGDDRRLVLRRYAWPGFLEDEPMAPRREVDALHFAVGQGLAAPSVIAADVDGAEVEDGVPLLLMERLPGKAVGDPDVWRLAEAAAGIHRVVEPFGHRYFRWFDRVEVRMPGNATDQSLWEWALGVWSSPPPEFRAVFIHRDFHPGNVLWSRGRVTGIVDWANACQGPAECDVATCRGNLMRSAGAHAADAFIKAYRAITGSDLHAYWEVVGVLEHGPSPWADSEVLQGEYRLRVAQRSLGA